MDAKENKKFRIMGTGGRLLYLSLQMNANVSKKWTSMLIAAASRDNETKLLRQPLYLEELHYVCTLEH